MARKTKMSPIDRDLNAELDEALAKAKPLPSHVGEEIQAAARRTVAKMHGGARPGAGRKPLGKVRLQAQVKKATLLALNRAAGGERGIGLVLDQLAARGFFQRKRAGSGSAMPK
jgi:hypothetical protein